MRVVTPIVMNDLVKSFEICDNKCGIYSWSYKGQHIKATVLIAAIYRHLTEYNKGYNIDEEGQSHLAAIIASVAILMDMQNQNVLIDDRNIDIDIDIDVR